MPQDALKQYRLKGKAIALEDTQACAENASPEEAYLGKRGVLLQLLLPPSESMLTLKTALLGLLWTFSHTAA